MKTITRNAAIVMYETLGAMALGHLNEDTLDIVMDNFNACRKVSDDMQKLNEELAKRIYEGVDEKRKEEYFKLVTELEELRRTPVTAEKAAVEKALAAIKEVLVKMEAYEDVAELYKKHNAVYMKLRAKEVEVELTELNGDDFIKGVIKGKKDAPVHELRAIFAPMFKEGEKKEADFSELDELLAE